MRLHRSGFAVLFLAALLPAASGCSRAVSVGTDPTSYSILVDNQIPRSMTIFWSDGTGEPRLLGTVRPSGEERFIIASPARAQITVTARDANRTMNLDFPITLRAGITQRVIVRSSS